MSDAAGPWPAPVELLPHGAEACHIERILEFVPGELLRASWNVPDAGILYDEKRGGVPGWAGLEVMAQGAGLYLGLSRRSATPAPRSGYLVGVRRAEITRPLYPARAQLLIEAQCETARLEAGEMGTFRCRILCAETTYLTARLMLWCGSVREGDT